MSTLVRTSIIKVLRRLPVRHFVARSILGHPYVCHLGDGLGEMPFYNRQIDLIEILVMSRWCRSEPAPLILDVGANTGFIASQLAQELEDRDPVLFCFEPVPTTFSKLLKTIQLLKLEARVFPVCAAVSNAPGLVELTFSEWNSMLAQVTNGRANPRVGDRKAWAGVVTLDQVVRAVGRSPSLIKIDVEGHEVGVMRGAPEILAGPEKPAVSIEFNPLTLQEEGVSRQEFVQALNGYRLFSLGDFGQGVLKPGQEVVDLTGLDAVCNVFCVPDTPALLARWEGVWQDVEQTLAALPGA